jgi:hypothetical protein
MRGCRPRVDGTHKVIVTAQVEIAEGKVSQLIDAPAVAAEPAGLSDAPAEYAQMIVQGT